MDWIKVTIFTSSEGIEPLSGRLYGTGITGIEIEDEKDFNDFLENNTEYWDYVDDELRESKKGETKVIVYVSDNASGYEQLALIKDEISAMKSLDCDGVFGRLELETDGVSEEDWANNWRQYYHPIEIGEKILIKPVWEDIEATDRVVFDIEPGLSFGTGSHETTQLCLENLEKRIKSGMKVLDLGCGSGILSVIALLLGADKAVAVDIDPNAVDIAYENAERNGIGKDRYTVYAGNILTDERIQREIGKDEYDIVLANIVADVIIALAPAAKRYMKRGGAFITSGIIDSRAAEVEEALKNAGFEIADKREKKDWVAMVCG